MDGSFVVGYGNYHQIDTENNFQALHHDKGGQSLCIVWVDLVIKIIYCPLACFFLLGRYVSFFYGNQNVSL